MTSIQMYILNLHKPVILILGLALLSILSGCTHAEARNKDPRDPWESTNRQIYAFNDNFDNYIMKPVSRGYQAITPDWLDTGFTNFFNNLRDVPNSINNLLQGKPVAALSDIGRLCINSTFGLLGFFDVASHLGLERHNEDFAQTLGVWGVPFGNYVVLPFLGPSSLRGSVGWVADFNTDPYYYHPDRWTYYGLMGLDLIDRRADLLGASRILEQASFDPYTFHRETYFQRRTNLVYDGNPPLEVPSLEELDLLNDVEITPAR